MNVWRLIPHHNNREGAIAWTKRTGRISIGWGRIGSVEKYHSQDEIKESIRSHYPSPPFPNNGRYGAPSLWNLFHNVEAHDLVILTGDKGRSLVVEVLGPYVYDAQDSPSSLTPETGEYYNQREIQVTTYDPDKVWFAAKGMAVGQPIYQTLIRCAQPVDFRDF